MNIIFKKVVVICASALVAISFYSCNKDDAPITEMPREAQQVQSEGMISIG